MPATLMISTKAASACPSPLAMGPEPLMAREGHASSPVREWARSLTSVDGPAAQARKLKDAGRPHLTLAPEPSLVAEDEASEWKRLLVSLVSPGQKPNLTPLWWDAEMPFRARLQTWTTTGLQDLAGTSAPSLVNGPTISLQITLGGCGQSLGEDGKPQTNKPGRLLIGTRESVARVTLPTDSPEWTFARIEISHPYFQQRITEQAQQVGQAVEIRPDDALTASLLRLVRAEALKSIHEPADAERTLFDFVLSFEQWARRKADGTRETERLMADTRSCVLAKLPQAIDVETLAARFGMSRCHFSHYFRRVTGMTPGRFATEVRLHKVEEMLLETREPLKCIADACGFANPNHLCKVFRRLRHITPTVFRQKAQ